MKSKGYKTEISEIDKLVNKLSSMNESFRFCKEDEFDDEVPTEDFEEEPMEEPESEMGDLNDSEVSGDMNDEVNQIRKICLNGMSRLCDNPENENYQKLKKIFQMVDKVEKTNNQVTESKIYYAVNKETKNVDGEFDSATVKGKKELVEMAMNSLKGKGLDSKNYKLVSEEKIIK